MQDCFACRLMRAAGITSVGALIGGYGALFAGVPRSEAVWYAIGGGLAVFFLVNKLLARRAGDRAPR